MSNDPSWWDLIEFLDLRDVDAARPESHGHLEEGLSIVTIEDLMDD